LPPLETSPFYRGEKPQRCRSRSPFFIDGKYSGQAPRARTRSEHRKHTDWRRSAWIRLGSRAFFYRGEFARRSSGPDLPPAEITSPHERGLAGCYPLETAPFFLRREFSKSLPRVGFACIAAHTEKQRVAEAIGPLGTDIQNEAIRDRCPERRTVGGAHTESGIAGTKNPGFAGGFARCRDISSFS
jgi:hypothetical protein